MRKRIRSQITSKGRHDQRHKYNVSFRLQSLRTKAPVGKRNCRPFAGLSKWRLSALLWASWLRWFMKIVRKADEETKAKHFRHPRTAQTRSNHFSKNNFENNVETVSAIWRRYVKHGKRTMLKRFQNGSIMAHPFLKTVLYFFNHAKIAAKWSHNY